MMRTLRENTKVIMLITALAFVGLMVFEWGMDLSGMSSAEARGGEIGRINGESISYEEYNAIQRRLYEQYQASRPGEPVTSAVDREIEKAAWDELVLDRLIRQEIRRRGLEASEAEVRRAARFMPPPELFASELFQTDGQFDLAKYQQFLASPAADDGFLLQLEAYYRDIIPREKLYAQVVSGSYIPDSELWRRWRDQYETARVRYIALDPAVIVPEGAVTVTDDEIADFYRRHRNDFQRPAQAVVRYTVLEKTPTAADTAAARDRALQLRQEILAGADFAEVAQRESADRMSAAMGGDLGTFGRGQMVPAFEEAVWSLPIDRVSEPVLTPFGYHLIQVRRRTGDEAEARHILIPIELTETTADALYARADSLEMLGLTRSVEEAARELGLEARTAELNPDLPFIAGIGAVDDGAEWAFEDAEPGEVSPVFETQSAFYMLELIQSTPAGVLSLEEATPGIRARMLVNRRLERARQTGREIVDEIRRSSLEQVAEARGLELHETEPFTRVSFVPGLGQANAAIGTAFGLEPGQTSGLVEADGMLYVIQVIERTEPDRKEFEAQKDAFRARMSVGLEQSHWSRFVAALQQKAKIVDRREELRRLVEEI